jgi:hypothetical protein
VDERSAKIATICECIDHCFAFAMWCEDFAPYLNEEDMIWGLDRTAELLSDATRLQSFLALRKLDEFFVAANPKPGDLAAAELGIDVPNALKDVGGAFLVKEERVMINKGVAHLTDSLSLDDDSEVDLNHILKRSIPVLTELVEQLRKLDTAQEATYWLDRSTDLIARGKNMKTAGEQLIEQAQAE